MTFDEVVKTTTQDEIVPTVVDSILNSNVLTMRLLGNPKPWVGELMKFNVKVSKSTAGGSFDGFDTFSTTRTNNRVQMQFNVKGFYQSVVLSNMERAVNNTAAKVLDLLGLEMESAKDDMIDGIGTTFYSDGTGNGSKDFTGLAAAVDDGSVAATYGGLNRSVTYTTLQSSVTTGIGNLTLAAMATSFDAATVGSDKPTIIVTTEAVWSFYEQLLQPTVRAGYDAGGFAQVTKTGTAQNRGALKGEIGFDALWYRGVPMVKDEKCTAGYMYFLNENYLGWYNLPHPDNKMQSGSSMIEGYYAEEGPKPISWTGLKDPINQDAVIGQFILYGELVNRNPNRSSVMQGITGV
ncbi:hypothetical protein LCGC14_0568250 [marine sediment metagenome]|uniref:Phage major capsid protein n=1 Tax=marine sediment metagenome TaxID=412755 RepID=A0A0F9UT96_9ZZZZ